MDITGYRTRSTPSLMQATTGPLTYDVRRKSKRQSVLPAALKVVLVLGILGLAWAGITRAARHQASAGQGDAGSKTVSEGSHTAAGAVEGGAAAKSSTKSTARTEELLRARVERGMRLTPSYRGPGKAESWPVFGNANRLLLASHGRLMWYRYDTDELRVIGEGKGEHMYYGAFTGEERGVLGEPTCLWVVAAPFDGHGGDGTDAEQGGKGQGGKADTREWLLQLDLESGRELSRVQLDSNFTHDAVRRRERVYVASTGEGTVLELGLPGMNKRRELPLFTAKEHVNTLAPTSDDTLWAVLHNLGSSELAQVDLKTGKELRRLTGIGHKAHGLVFYQSQALTLDSEGGALLAVDLSKDKGGQVEKLWQAPEPGKYLKGLAVVDDVAFFGVAPAAPRARRADPGMDCQLAAFDLQQRTLLWRRQLPTHGLLNIVAAPHLTVESTTYAVTTRPLLSYRDKPQFAQAVEAAQKWAMQQEREAQGAHGEQAVQQQQEQQTDHVQAAKQEAAAQEQAQQGGQGVAAQEQQGGQQGSAAEQAQQGQQALHDAVAQQAQHDDQAHQAEAHAAQARQEQVQEVRKDEAQAQLAQAAQHQQAQAEQHEQQDAQQRQREHDEHQQLQHEQAQQAGSQHRNVQMQQQQQALAVGGGGGTAEPAQAQVQALSEAEPLPADDPLSQYPARLDAARWSSGLPRLLLDPKARAAGLGAGAQLRLLRRDVAALKAQVAALPEEDWGEERQRAANAWFTGREGVLGKFKPGTDSILLVFSDQHGQEVFRFPWYQRFQALVDPLLLQILGPGDVSNVLRLQLARMPPGSEIKRHLDAGGYAASGHRIHVVLQTNPGVSFRVCDSHEHARAVGGQAAASSPPCVPVHAEEGLAFELNNQLPHLVANEGDEARIHLLIDVAETPRRQRQLAVGEVCEYQGEHVVCGRRDAADSGAAQDGAGGGVADPDGDEHGGDGL